MLLTKNYTSSTDTYRIYEYTVPTNDQKHVTFFCEPSNRISSIYLFEGTKSVAHYRVRTQEYMEVLTPHEDGDLEQIDTDKLVKMICFDEGIEA